VSAIYINYIAKSQAFHRIDKGQPGCVFQCVRFLHEF